jgi:hypothetical protein
MFRHQFLQALFLCPLSPHERTIRLDHDTPFSTPTHDIVPLQPRMQLPLAYIQRPTYLFHVGLELIQVVHAVIADTERANLTRFLRFNESFPCAFTGFGAAVGRVDQVEIDVREICLREGRCD